MSDIFKGWDSGKTSGVWTDYTPTWTAATTNPAIGNGTLTGRYIKLGNLVVASMVLTFGSTTVFGTGDHYLSIPVTAASGIWEGTARFRNAGTANYVRIASIITSINTDKIIFFNGVSGNDTTWTPTSPFAMANSDTLVIQITYEAA